MLHKTGIMGRETKNWLASRVLRGAVVLDVGANQGIYSLLAARLAGPTGKVYAFEPEPLLAASLRRNIRLNRAETVDFYSYALGSRKSQLVLERGAFNSGDNRLSPLDDTAGELASSVAVEVWDDLSVTRRIDVMKIDVQGWEHEVFMGMKQTLSTMPPRHIMVEFWPYGLRRAGSDPEGLLWLLHGAGYELAVSGPSARALRSADFSSLCSEVRGGSFVDIVGSAK